MKLIVGLMLPWKQFFLFSDRASIYCKTRVHKFHKSFNSLMHHTAKALKKSICMVIISSMIILILCSMIVTYGAFWLKH